MLPDGGNTVLSTNKNMANCDTSVYDDGCNCFLISNKNLKINYKRVYGSIEMNYIIRNIIIIIIIHNITKTKTTIYLLLHCHVCRSQKSVMLCK